MESSKRSQQGGVVITFVSLILIALLLMALANFRNHHFQTQQAKNRVLHQQLFWQAEAGLACVMALHLSDTAENLLDLDTSICLADIQFIKTSEEPLIFDVVSQAASETGLSVFVTNTLEQVDNGGLNIDYQWRQGAWRDH